METSNLKNTVILKSIPSNIIEEAIIVLKKNIKIKEFELQNKRKTESTTEKKEQKRILITLYLFRHFKILVFICVWILLCKFLCIFLYIAIFKELYYIMEKGSEIIFTPFEDY